MGYLKIAPKALTMGVKVLTMAAMNVHSSRAFNGQGTHEGLLSYLQRFPRVPRWLADVVEKGVRSDHLFVASTLAVF